MADVARACIAQIEVSRLLTEGFPAGVQTMQIRRIGTTDEVAQCAGCVVRQAQEGRLPRLGSLQDGIGKVRPDGSERDRIDVLTVWVVWCDRAAIEDGLVQDSADGIHDFGRVQLLVTTKTDQKGLQGFVVEGCHEQQHLHHLAWIPAFGFAEAFSAAQPRGWDGLLRAIGER